MSEIPDDETRREDPGETRRENTDETRDEGRGGAEGELVAGRYRLLGVLGQGGMARVWRARDEALGRIVAVKEMVLPSALSVEQAAEMRVRLMQEARAAAALPHPSVVTVHDVLDDGDRPWIVMELVAGPSLQEAVDGRGPLPPGEVARIGLELLDALCLAHERGITHRDVKPSNVLLDGGRVVLTDFGIAAVTGGQLTATDGMVGSPGYVAPERLRDSRGAGPAADLWSLGATLYTAVEGHNPYVRPGGGLAMLSAALTEDAPPPRRAGALGPLLRSMLNREPLLRPTPAEIRRALSAVVEAAEKEGTPTRVLTALLPTSPPIRPHRFTVGRPRTWAAAGAAVTAGAVVAATALLLGTRGAERPAPPARPLDPCSLITPEQLKEIGRSSYSLEDQRTCAFGSLTVRVEQFSAKDGRSGEELAKTAFSDARRRADHEKGLQTNEPGVVAKTLRPRDVDLPGAEAFAQDEIVSTSFGTFAEAKVCVRTGSYVYTVVYSPFQSELQPGTRMSDISEIARRAAGYVLGNLTRRTP